MRNDIISLENPLVKRVAGLHQSHKRREERRFIAEGQRSIDGLLSAGCVPETLLVRCDLSIPAHWPPGQVVHIGERVCAKLSQAQTPSGYLGIFPIPQPSAPDLGLGGLVLLDMQDPGNVGTLVRSAAAFGVQQVVLIGCADPFAYKTVQATAGVLAQVALHVMDAATAPSALRPGAPLCALVVGGGEDPARLSRHPRWLLVGSEAHGLRPEWTAQSNERMTLPMQGQVESLNAAVAASIAMYLFSRQA